MAPNIRVFDIHGNEQSLAWARNKYGPFIIYTAAPGDNPEAWRLTALREKNDSALVATAHQADGNPQPGVRVCFYWPDAPTLHDAGPLGAPFEGINAGRAVSGYTDVNGNVGFGMGPGAHYNPTTGERGPHALWMHGAETRSDVILGLGMITDDHLHLNAEWTLTEEEDPPNGDEDLVALLRQLADKIHAIADLVEGSAND